MGERLTVAAWVLFHTRRGDDVYVVTRDGEEFCGIRGSANDAGMSITLSDGTRRVFTWEEILDVRPQ